MSIFLFCLLIALWVFISIQTHFFLSCLTAFLFCSLIFVISSLKQPRIKLPKTLLGFGKSVLVISFWSCVAFCLLAYLKSIVCTNCIYNHLKQDDFSNTSIIKKIWISYPRFAVIIGLFFLWIIVFLLNNKKGKTND